MMHGTGISQRYVALHPTKGVLLTDPLVLGGSDLKELVVVPTLVWSNDITAAGVASAPTFENWEQVDSVLARVKNPITPEDRKKLKLCDVWPEGDLLQATPDACRNACLPSWDPTGEEL